MCTHRPKVVCHHGQCLLALDAAHVDLLVDAAGADEGGVQLLGVVGGHDDNAVGRVHHPVQHVEQPSQVQLVAVLPKRLAKCRQVRAKGLALRLAANAAGQADSLLIRVSISALVGVQHSSDGSSS